MSDLHQPKVRDHPLLAHLSYLELVANHETLTAVVENLIVKKLWRMLKRSPKAVSVTKSSMKTNTSDGAYRVEHYSNGESWDSRYITTTTRTPTARRSTVTELRHQGIKRHNWCVQLKRCSSATCRAIDSMDIDADVKQVWLPIPTRAQRSGRPPFNLRWPTGNWVSCILNTVQPWLSRGIVKSKWYSDRVYLRMNVSPRHRCHPLSCSGTRVVSTSSY